MSDDMKTLYGGVVLLTVCIVSLLLSRLRESHAPPSDQPPTRRPWWVRWALLGVALSMNWWFPPVYRTVPNIIWVALLAVGFVFGVWRWIAFFAEKRRA